MASTSVTPASVQQQQVQQQTIHQQQSHQQQLYQQQSAVAAAAAAVASAPSHQIGAAGSPANVAAAAAVVHTNAVADVDSHEWTYDPNEPRYCICNQISYGEMVACDNLEVSILLHFFLILLQTIDCLNIELTNNYFFTVSCRVVPLPVR